MYKTQKRKQFNKIFKIVGFVFVLFVLFLLSSCNKNREETIKGISFEDQTFVYDGTAKSIYIGGTLPDNLLVKYINNEQTEAGTYEITVQFVDLENKEKKYKDLKANLTIEQQELDLSLKDQEFNYEEGKTRSLKITESLPEGVSVEYLNNNQVNAGIYEVIAKFNVSNPNYKPLDDLKANLIINKAKYDFDFETKLYVYDGEEKELNGIKGDLPEEIEIEYSNKKLTNPGVLEVTATFIGNTNDNYESSRKAYLVIYDEDLTMTNEIKNAILNGKLRNVLFGKYPQTVVEDIELVNELNLLDKTNSNGYYEFEGDEYKKLKANPQGSDYKFNSGMTIISDKEYYFKVEPVKWDILEVENETLILIANLILDQEQFYSSDNEREISGDLIYPNNYEHSVVRNFLNNDFYDQAFTTNDKTKILTSSIDNSSKTTNSVLNHYASKDTEDKVYLLSYDEVKNKYYKNPNEIATNSSDYAKVLGIYISNNYSKWWLRSPYDAYAQNVNTISALGDTDTDAVDDVDIGVRPVLKININ